MDSNGFQFVRIGNQQNKFASKTKVQNRKSKSWQNAFWIAEGKAYNFHGTKYAEYLNKDQIASLLPACITIFISR